MEEENSAAAPAVDTSTYTAEEMTARAARKRYEGLSIVRTKANKGKGAWYWAHLEPILLHSHETGMAKAVKLRCSLCDAQFSASNPSRTASEHLKRGTCPNFTAIPQPISSFPLSPTPTPHPAPSTQSPSAHYSNHRKRNAVSGGSASYHVSPLTVVDPSRFCCEFGYHATTSTSNAIVSANTSSPFHHHHRQHQHQHQHFLLSGGKDDLGALAMLEDSVKKLKSPRTSPGPTLGKAQVDSAFHFLADWVYECCGAVSFTSLEHPRFRDFLQQVGLPAVSGREMAATRLDLRYEEARAVAEERIRDALFFQLASHGWRTMCCNAFDKENCIPFNLVNMTLNLPNGTSIFRRAVFTGGVILTEYAEEVLWDTLTDICGDSTRQQQQQQQQHQCVGIVGDGFVARTLSRLESRHQWMVNLTCQLHGIRGLLKRFSKDLPIVKTVYQNCMRLVTFVNHRHSVRRSLNTLQLQEYGQVKLLSEPHQKNNRHTCSLIHNTVNDILASSRALQLLLEENQFKKDPDEEEESKQVAEIIKDQTFWNEVRAVSSLIKLVNEMSQEVETERPLVGQCLLIWKDVRRRIKDWCEEFNVDEKEAERSVEKRFEKNYHPAWAAAYVLDPLHLVKDSSGKYLPPFKYLIPEQERDVDKLVTRLVRREEEHIVLMELMKWRTEGLDPVYAQAVQMREKDPTTGKMKVANPRSGRLVWETHLTEFKVLGRVAARIIFMQATACGFRCNWSLLRWAGLRGGSRISVERAQKIIFLAAQSRLEKREFSTEEEKDGELLASVYADEEDDDVISDVFVDPCV